MRSKTMARAIALSLCGALGGGCVSQGFPTHGGGKRFFYEQHLVSASAERALAEIDFSTVPKTGPVALYVVAMGDQGGGVDAGGGLGGLLGLSGATFASSAGSMTSFEGGQGYMAHSVSNARDIEYLRGLVLRHLLEQNVQVAREWEDERPLMGEVYVLVDEFGIAKSDMNIIIYSERKLAARTSLEAFYYSNPANAKPKDGVRQVYRHLGSGECMLSYEEQFALGLGPINDAEERFAASNGPIPGSDAPVEMYEVDAYGDDDSAGDDDAESMTEEVEEVPQ